MQLLECIIRKPGLLEKKILKFDERTTVIYGKNESGKSLIAKAIIDTLWGVFSETAILNGDAWNDLYFEISFINSLKRYRFIRDRKESFSVNYIDFGIAAQSGEKEILRKDFGLKDRNSGNGIFSDLYNETKDRDTVSLLNKINIDTFVSLAYLQDPLEISRDGKINYSVIKRIILNDSSNFYSFFENISDSFSNDGLASNNSLLSEIAKVESNLNNIKLKLDVSSLHVSKFERIKKEKIRLGKELKECNAELSKIRNQKTKLLSIQNNLKKLDKIYSAVSEKNQEKEVEQKKRNSILEMEDEIRQQYPQFYNFNESNIRNLKKIQETYREVRDVYEEIGNFHLELGEKKNRFKNIILFINVVSILVLAGLLGFNYVFPVPVLNEYKYRIIIALLTLSIGSSAMFFIFGILNFRSGDLKKKMNKKYNVERKLEGILKKNNIILNEYKLETIYEYLVKYFEDYGEYSIKQSELLKMKDTLKEYESDNTVDDELQKLKIRESLFKDEIDQELKLLEDIGTIQLSTENIGRIINEKNRKIIDLKEKIRHTNSIITQINKEKSETDKGNEISFLMNEKTTLAERLNKLNSYKTSLEFILNNIKEAIIRREEKQFGELLTNTIDIFHFITDNQYKESIKDETIEQMIKGKTGDEILNVPVIHLILLSVKLAITDLFDDLEINLPLIIDEPFQNMDENRTSRFREILDEKSRNRQIVIFTHNSMYKDWGSYIEL